MIFAAIEESGADLRLPTLCASALLLSAVLVGLAGPRRAGCAGGLLVVRRRFVSSRTLQVARQTTFAGASAQRIYDTPSQVTHVTFFLESLVWPIL